MPGHRVFVTGYSCVSSLGIGSAAHRARLRDAAPCLTPLSVYGDRVYVGRSDDCVPDGVARRTMRHIAKGARTTFVALDEALQQAGLPQEELGDPGNGLIAATTSIAFEELKDLALRTDALGLEGAHSRFMDLSPDATTGYIAVERGIHGPQYTVSNGCNSSATAIELAYHLIRSGVLRRALVVAFESETNEFSVAPFLRSSALALTPQCIPYSPRGTGFHLGEGAGALVLEREDVVGRSGRIPRAEILSCASLSESRSMHGVSSDPFWLAETIKKCLVEGGIAAPEVCFGYGNGHRVSDSLELKALRKALGEQSRDIPITSLKPYFGHLVAASVIVELICGMIAMEDHFVPCVPALSELLDEANGFAIVAEKPLEARYETFLKISLATGNRYSAILIRAAQP